jgi:CTP-dependent riboflavin kinase
MATRLMLQGRVAAGVGEGARFMGLEWVRDAVRHAVGFDPYPGTLNLRLSNPDVLPRWLEIRDARACVLPPPPTASCGGRLVPVVIVPDILAGVIVPDLTRYDDDILEVIAAVHLRSRLQLRDGDVVTVSV